MQDLVLDLAQDVVVVGASLAGATAACTLRELGHEGRIVLVGDEPEPPYERPPLSKELLLGTKAATELHVRPPADYAALEVELRLGVAAAGLDTAAREVLLADGGRLRYDACVVATGAVNVRPPLPGLDLPGVHSLRTLADAQALRAHALTASRAVVVGMGLVGCETAAALRELGLEVTVVDTLRGPLLAHVGPAMSERVRGWHDAHGVRLRGGHGVAAVVEHAGALGVRTTDDQLLPADLVVVGVGARPAVDWLLDSGLALGGGVLGGGVLVDGSGRTSDSRVWAAGDVAAVRADGGHRRAEHWSAAVEQGRRVAHALRGLPLPAAEPPSWWSAQYGHLLQCVGTVPPTHSLVVREDGARLTACYLDEGVVAAVVTVDNGRDGRAARALLGRTPDPAQLADAGVPLKQLARA